jgi:hypothetical protein
MSALFLAWMDDRGLGGGPLSNIVEIGGGTQNVTLRFTREKQGIRAAPRTATSSTDQQRRPSGHPQDLLVSTTHAEGVATLFCGLSVVAPRRGPFGRKIVLAGSPGS